MGGERLGTYDGHCGAVWALDPRWDTTHLVTGAADNTVRLWDIQTGKELNSIQTKSAVRTCGFSYSGNMVCYTTDKQMGYPCEINVVDSRNFNPDETVFKRFVFLTEFVIVSTSNGRIERKLITSTEIPSFSRTSAAFNDSPTILWKVTIVISDPSRSTFAFPNGIT